MVHKEAPVNSITLHNLPSSLYGLLKQKARREGKSLNRTIQDLLTEALGLSSRQLKKQRKDVYDEICGAMPIEERARLEEAEREFEEIDAKDWE
jgi:hypothetical protein